jgi:hypothetical protein
VRVSFSLYLIPVAHNQVRFNLTFVWSFSDLTNQWVCFDLSNTSVISPSIKSDLILSLFDPSVTSLTSQSVLICLTLQLSPLQSSQINSMFVWSFSDLTNQWVCFDLANTSVISPSIKSDLIWPLFDPSVTSLTSESVLTCLTLQLSPLQSSQI